MKEINIGDRVRPINDTGEGVVVGIRNGIFDVEDENGFCIPMTADELIVVPSGEKAEQQRAALTAKKGGGNKNTKKAVVKRDAGNAIRDAKVVDLHSDLSRSPSSNIIESQLAKFKYELNRHVGQHGVKIIFIHGQGLEDVLRNELIKELDRRKDKFSYCDAPSPQYKYHTAIKVTVK